MKKLLPLIPLLYISTSFGLSANQINIDLLFGGLQTPAQNLSSTSTTSQYNVGGPGFSIGLTHFFPQHFLNLQHNLLFGLQGAYSQLADNKYSQGQTVKQQSIYSGFVVSALGIMQYSPQGNWLIQGKVGAAKVTQSFKRTFSGSTVTSNSISSIKPEMAFEAIYKTTKNIGLGFGYSYISGSTIKLNQNTTIAAIGTLNAQFVYEF